MPGKNQQKRQGSFAIIETGGKQHIVREGDILTIEKLPKGTKDIISFDKVLLFDDGKETRIGTPYINGAKVLAQFVEEGRGKKIIVFKYKPKVRYRVKQGYRHPFTKVKVESLEV